MRKRELTLIVFLALMLCNVAAGNSPLAPTIPYTYHTYLPAVTGSYTTLVGTSRYMQTTDTGTLYQLGCAEANIASPGATVGVILDFGQPAYVGSTYGTYIFGSYAFRSTATIQAAAQAYLAGFYDCSVPGDYLRLAIGTSNYGSGVTQGHGQAWAAMINNLIAWINSRPDYANRVSARGANDMEPGFGNPTATRAWVSGYASAYVKPAYLYNYGSCDGCAYSSCPSCSPINGWTYEDIYYVSWGAAPAWPVPEIYLTTGVQADQWYRIALYGINNHNGTLMQFLASLTQYQACQTNGPCGTTANPPLAGWTQLFQKLNSDARTAQPWGWATDISWQN